MATEGRIEIIQFMIDLPLALRAVGLLVTGKEIKDLQIKYDPGRQSHLL